MTAASLPTLMATAPRTPAVVGDRIYTFGITGILTCFDDRQARNSGRSTRSRSSRRPTCSSASPARRWSRATRCWSTSAARAPRSSPSTQDKGEVVWQALDDRASYSSPIAVGQGKERQVVFSDRGQGSSACRRPTALLLEVPAGGQADRKLDHAGQLGDLLLGSSVTYGSVGLKLGDEGRQADGQRRSGRTPSSPAISRRRLPSAKTTFTW